jgi:hypothetical protein
LCRISEVDPTQKSVSACGYPVAPGASARSSTNKETKMKKFVPLIAIGVLCAGATLAQSAEEEIIQMLLQDNAYIRQNLVDAPDTYSKEGALEFWSSGGLMQEIPPGGGPERPWDHFNLEPKHIRVIELVPGQAAVAMYYSEGSMQPKGAAPVPHYFTRVTQVFVKEDGEWKIRASHWSPVRGGSGTSQTALEE